jgi:hypothetical protein
MAQCFIAKYCENIIAIGSILMGKRALQVGTKCMVLPLWLSILESIPFDMETNLMQHWWDQQNHLIEGGGGRRTNSSSSTAKNGQVVQSTSLKPRSNKGDD